MDGDLSNLFIQAILFGCVVISTLLVLTIPVWTIVKFLKGGKM